MLVRQDVRERLIVPARSHCLLIVHAATTDPASGVRSVGKLTLCDLAGSERINKTGATGEQPSGLLRWIVNRIS